MHKVFVIGGDLLEKTYGTELFSREEVRVADVGHDGERFAVPPEGVQCFTRREQQRRRCTQVVDVLVAGWGGSRSMAILRPPQDDLRVRKARVQLDREWLLRAVAGDPADLQIMYGLAGERRLDERELGWLPGYAQSVPVRIGNAASEQLQLDFYGWDVLCTPPSSPSTIRTMSGALPRGGMKSIARTVPASVS